ncbi:hypothetical protein LTR97_008027 [Elasticomyces elasticus]|uniref:Transmembrane protein n=1 Tax=Elasticomyces elasticus TaxID=574655 RepID=A0AAN7ZMP1_9PEZI|nr:hypothetical protein LTR97_008027 [Elasticomyces elasticus]
MPPMPTSFNSQALSNALTIAFGIVATVAAVAGIVIGFRQYRRSSPSPAHASPTTHATRSIDLTTYSTSTESIVTVHQPVLPPPVYIAEHEYRRVDNPARDLPRRSIDRTVGDRTTS